jgi:tRNA C32,U32 (ribose-2'-O)-methylase TrmJ
MTENEYYQRIEQIEKYLKSKEFAKYSSENFAKNIYKQLIIKESNQSTLISILRLILKKIEVYSFKLLNKIWK